MRNEKESKKLLYCWSGCIITMLCVGLLISIQPAKAQFVLSSWNDDDGYGQGISVVAVFENSTGIWLPVLDPAAILPADETTVEMNETENTAIRLSVGYTLNHSLNNLPIPDTSSGLNIMRSGIEVKVLGVIVFSQENLTLFYGGLDSPTTYWYYTYITIPILIRSGVIYEVELTYEIFPYLYE